MSVIVPTHGRSDFLRQTVDSVLAQTFKDIEIIVVEDGSATAADTLVGYGERVRYVWQPNQGVSVARNTGVQHARAQWLAFLDDDDLWVPEKLERQLQVAERSPGDGLIHTDYYALLGDVLQPGPRFVPGEHVPSGDVGRELFLDNFVVMSSALVRREAFDSVGGFDPRVKSAADYDLWLRLSRRHAIRFVNERLTIYRDHPSMSSDSRRLLHGTVMVLSRFVRSHPAVWNEWGRPTVRARLASAYWQAGYAQFCAESYPEARRLFLAGWRWKPWFLRPLAYGAACLTGRSGVGVLRSIRRNVFPANA